MTGVVTNLYNTCWTKRHSPSMLSSIRPPQCGADIDGHRLRRCKRGLDHWRVKHVLIILWPSLKLTRHSPWKIGRNMPKKEMILFHSHLFFWRLFCCRFQGGYVLGVLHSWNVVTLHFASCAPVRSWNCKVSENPISDHQEYYHFCWDPYYPSLSFFTGSESISKLYV